jgi:hypothetical protein
MKPEPVPIPASIKETSAALHIECYALNGCAIVVQRLDVADPRLGSPDFRWKVEIANSDRHPDLWEIREARQLVPEDIHLGMPFPRAGFERDGGYSFHLWEIKDENLTDKWEFDSIIDRRDAGQVGGE